MKHLISTCADLSLSETQHQLEQAHNFLVASCLKSLARVPHAGRLWGVEMKRMRVDLTADTKPVVVRKDSERFGEVVNMVATLERLLSALRWFEQHPNFSGLRVKECHPSTSSAKGSNDLMLENATGVVIVRCEISDVASGVAGSNGKERKDIASLGCADGVPADGVRRFICTSPEFARAIQSPKREWAHRLHSYREFAVGDATGTVLVELISNARRMAKQD